MAVPPDPRPTPADATPAGASPTPPPPNPAMELIRQFLDQPPQNSLSPMGRWLGGILRTAPQPGWLTAEYTVREEMTNPGGTIHGGVVSAILDDIIGAAVFSLCLPTYYVSLNLHVNFLGPAKPGDLLVARTQVVRTGKTVVYMEGYLEHADGRQVAHAVTNLISTGQPNFLAQG